MSDKDKVKFQSQVKDLIKENNNLQEKMNSLNNRLESKDKQISNLKNKRQNLLKEIASLKRKLERIPQLENNNKKLSRENQNLLRINNDQVSSMSNNSQTKEINTLRLKVNTLETEGIDKQYKIQALEKQCNDLQKQLKSKQNDKSIAEIKSLIGVLLKLVHKINSMLFHSSDKPLNVIYQRLFKKIKKSLPIINSSKIGRAHV